MFDDRGMVSSGPGADERSEKPIFGEPDEGEHILAPATVMNLQCLAGCRYYSEVLLEEPTMDDQDWSTLRRICRRYQDHEADWDLSEETIYACSEFAPRRRWSFRARLRMLIAWTELAMGRKELSPDWKTWHLPEVVMAMGLSRVLGLARLYPNRKERNNG